MTKTTLSPGTYRSVDSICWSAFTLRANGAVEFIDARDGHTVWWSINHPDGREWVAAMARRLNDGTLVKEAA